MSVIDKMDLSDTVRAQFKAYERKLKLMNFAERNIENTFWRMLPFVRHQNVTDMAQVTSEQIEDWYLWRRENCSEYTSHGDYRTLRLYYQRMHPEKNIFTFKPKPPKATLPVDQVLTEEEIRALRDACETVRDRALIMFLWDTGCRITEALSLNLNQVIIDQYGGVVIVNGKTGRRRLRLTACIPDLQNWLNQHPLKAAQDAPLWVTYNRVGTAGPRRLSVRTVQGRLKYLERKLGLKKSIHPHGIRHARSTNQAKRGFTETEMRILNGWSPGSRMPQVYIHLSGADVEKKVLRLAGIVQDESNKPGPLDPVECPRCHHRNEPGALYCTKCAFIVDEKTAQTLVLMHQKVIEDPEVIRLSYKK